MADSKNTAPRDYRDFTSHVQYSLHELSYFAQATQAMLELFNDHSWPMEDRELLTGVSYMLSRIQRDAKALVMEVDQTQGDYQLKPTSGSDKGASDA